MERASASGHWTGRAGRRLPHVTDPSSDLGRRHPLANRARRGAPDWARHQGHRWDHHGFAAVGALPVDADHDRAVALQSVDGATWTGPYPLDLVSASGVVLASTGPSWGATALVAARYGLIAVGTALATPGATLWWQSANGRDWRPPPTYAPLGPTTCTGEGCGPNGTLVGDGNHIVALRGAADAGVWTSSDGLAWQRGLGAERAPRTRLL